jgi:hypothetical protein
MPCWEEVGVSFVALGILELQTARNWFRSATILRYLTNSVCRSLVRLRRPWIKGSASEEQYGRSQLFKLPWFFKWGNDETERHSGVVHDQLDGLSSWRGIAELERKKDGTKI